jgi:hypothetical protein
MKTYRRDMWMRALNRFSKTEKKILMASIAVLLALSYLLYDDSLLYPQKTRGDEKSVGSLTSLENDVRRKSITDFVWIPGTKKDEIYNQDSIFTGDQSKASVQLADGSVIQIQENSLVNINVRNGQMQLDLRFGQLTGNGNSSIHVKTDTDEYTIDGKSGSFEVNRSSSGALDVHVLSGKAEIKGKKGRQDLKTNESLQISNNGIEKNQVDASIQLLTDDNVIMYRQVDKDPVKFAWKGKGPLSQYQLEIATEESFKKLISLDEVASESATVTDAMSEATYFWRVKGLNNLRKTLAVSKTQKFYLSYLQAPHFTTPQNDSTQELKALGPDADALKASFSMTWEASPRTTSFTWQLSDSETFTQIVAEKKITEKDAAIKKLQTPEVASGKYYARIRGYDAEAHPSPWSPIHAITVDIENEERLPAPKLNQTLTRFQMPQLLGRAPSAAESPQVSWTAVEQAKNYHWEIANNPSFHGAKAVDLNDTKMAWTGFKPGKYYYRVFARSELGQLSLASTTGEILVLSAEPTLNPMTPLVAKSSNPEAKAPEKVLNISWSAVPGANRYKLEIDKTAEFKAPLEKVVTAPSEQITLTEPGSYFVRVKAIGETDEDLSEYSKVEEANYTYKINLKAPVLTEPLNGTTVFLQKDADPYLWLGWQAVPGATGYILEYSTTADFSPVLLNVQQTETQFLIKTKIPYGKIFWRVRAISKFKGYDSEWTSWQFTILQQRNQGF